MKNKNAKLLSASFIVYLLLQAATGFANIYYSVFGCIQIADSAGLLSDSVEMQNQMRSLIIGSITSLLNVIAFALLAAIAIGTLVEKCGSVKEKLQKAWFVPGLLYVLQNVLFVINAFAEVFTLPAEYIGNSLATTAMSVGETLLPRAVIALLYFTLPRVLLENDLFVFKKETTQTQVATTDAE